MSNIIKYTSFNLNYLHGVNNSVKKYIKLIIEDHSNLYLNINAASIYVENILPFELICVKIFELNSLGKLHTLIYSELLKDNKDKGILSYTVTLLSIALVVFYHIETDTLDERINTILHKYTKICFVHADKEYILLKAMKKATEFLGKKYPNIYQTFIHNRVTHKYFDELRESGYSDIIDTFDVMLCDLKTLDHTFSNIKQSFSEKAKIPRYNSVKAMNNAHSKKVTIENIETHERQTFNTSKEFMAKYKVDSRTFQSFKKGIKTPKSLKGWKYISM